MLPLSARRLSQAPSPLLRRSASAVTQLSPTIRVAAVNPAGSLTTSISVVLQAGSRYEAKAGVANVLKNLSFKSNAHYSALGAVRTAEHMGAVLSASLSREHLTLTAECLKGDEQAALQLLASSLRPKFIQHELNEQSINTTLLESQHASQTPQIQALEVLHAVAFRQGLGNSIFASANEPVDLADIKAFWSQVTAESQPVGVIGTGISQEDLTNLVKHVFLEAIESERASASASTSSSAASSPKAKYFGGEERLSFDLHSLGHAKPTLTFAFGTTESPSSPALAILPYLLAPSRPTLKYSPASSPLGAAAEAASGPGTSIEAFVQQYSDASLFCVEVQAEGSKRLGDATAAAVSTLKSFKVSEEQLKRAVAVAKTELAVKWETPETLRQALAVQVFGKEVKALEDVFKGYDALTVESVQKALAELLKSKPSVASVARLSQMAYADELGL